MPPSLPSLPTEAWDRLERILERFEDAWRRGERPAIEDFVGGSAGEERRALLAELVHADLHYRWQAGEAAAVEAYLERYPELREAGIKLQAGRAGRTTPLSPTAGTLLSR